jgi:hypothetical protein
VTVINCETSDGNGGGIRLHGDAQQNELNLSYSRIVNNTATMR